MHVCVLMMICDFIMWDRKTLALSHDDRICGMLALNVFAKVDKQDRARWAGLYDHLNMNYLCI